MKPILSLLLMLASLPSLAQQAQPPHITVTGESTVYVQPDKILINLGVETWDMNVLTAKQQNNEVMAKAVTAIKGQGIAEKDIQTDHLSIEPRWRDSYERKQDGFLGYFVRNTLVLTLNDVTKVEDLVTKVLESGVNYIHGVEFQSTEFKKYREEAREMALKAAKEKAEKMAGVLEAKIGGVLEIQEYGSSPWYYSSWGSFGGGRNYMSTQNSISVREGNSPDISGTIALGKIAITANVNVSFLLNQ